MGHRTPTLPNALPGRFYKVAQVRRRAKTRCENLKRCRRVCHNALPPITARVVKLVDSGDSKSPAARRAGSSPAPGTTDKAALLFKQCGFFFISHVAKTARFFTLLADTTPKPWRHRFERSFAKFQRMAHRKLPDRVISIENSPVSRKITQSVNLYCIAANDSR